MSDKWRQEVDNGENYQGIKKLPTKQELMQTKRLLGILADKPLDGVGNTGQYKKFNYHQDRVNHAKGSETFGPEFARQKGINPVSAKQRQQLPDRK